MTRAILRSVIEAAALLAMLPACSRTLFEVSSERRDVAFRTDELEAFEQLVEGEGRTKGEVLAALGPPVTVIPQERGDVFVYRREAYDTQIVNLNPALVASVPSVSVYSNTDQSSRDDVVMVFFDAAGRARSFAASRGTLITSGSRAARFGQAFQELRR